MRPISRLFLIALTSASFVAMASCAPAQDKQLARDLQPPPRMEMAPPHGLTNMYFNQELQQAMERITAMRAELDALTLRLQALQNHLAASRPTPAPAPVMVAPPPSTVMPTPLMGEMAAPTQPEPDAQISKPVIEAKPEKPTAKPEPKAVAGKGVTAVRIGTHPDRVRIVFDVSGDKPNFTTNMDSAEKLLTVELTNTAWAGATHETFKNNPVIASYSAQDSGKGSVAAFALKGTSKILETKILTSPTRLVVDLAK